MLHEGIVDGKAVTASREQFSLWSVAAVNSLSVDIVKNSWRHGVYSWFDNNGTSQFLSSDLIRFVEWDSSSSFGLFFGLVGLGKSDMTAATAQPRL